LSRAIEEAAMSGDEGREGVGWKEVMPEATCR
jgi:hypothetical protein